MNLQWFLLALVIGIGGLACGDSDAGAVALESALEGRSWYACEEGACRGPVAHELGAELPDGSRRVLEIGFLSLRDGEGKLTRYPVRKFNHRDRESFPYVISDHELTLIYDEESFRFAFTIIENTLRLTDVDGRQAFFRSPPEDAQALNNAFIYGATFWYMPGMKSEAVRYDAAQTEAMVEMTRNKEAAVARFLVSRSPQWAEFDFGYAVRSEDGTTVYGVVVCTGMGSWDLDSGRLSVKLEGPEFLGALGGLNSWRDVERDLYGNILAEPSGQSSQVLLQPAKTDLDGQLGWALIEARTPGVTPRTVCQRKGVGGF